MAQRRIRGRRGLAGDEGGATAVEFALIAFPFFVLMFAIIELGLVFVLDTTLDNAVSQTGRLVRTGQALTMTEEQFLTNVCDRMSIFAGDCANRRLTVDVRVLPDFNRPPPDPMATGEFVETGLRFDTGVGGQIVLVSAWYRQPLFTPMLSHGLSRLGDGVMVLGATAAFRNEPF